MPNLRKQKILVVNIFFDLYKLLQYDSMENKTTKKLKKKIGSLETKIIFYSTLITAITNLFNTALKIWK